MHFSIASVYGIALGLVGLSTAQSQSWEDTLPVCGWQTLGFEEMTDLPAMSGGTAALTKPVPSRYARSQWQGFYAVTSSPGSQFLMPQGKNFAIAPNPATTPAVIKVEGELGSCGGIPDCFTSFQFQSIFLGAFVKGLLGGISAPSSAVIVNATGHTWRTNKYVNDMMNKTWTFRIEPAKTLLGLALSAQAMQVFEIPCEWYLLKSISFTAQAEDGANDGLVLAFDNFKLAQHVQQYEYIPNCRSLQRRY